MKRLILVHGDKGGIGKSTASRGLLDWSIREGKNYTAFDSDQRNPHLYRYYNRVHNVKKIDVKSQGGIDPVFNELSSGNQNVLVDLPAGVGASFDSILVEVDLNDALTELEARLTLVLVISRLKDSVDMIETTLDVFKKVPADFVIIKNLYFGEEDKFTRYDLSKVRKDASQRGAAEVIMPDLSDKVYDTLDGRNLPFMTAVEDSELEFATRQRVKTWVKRFDSELVKAKKYL